MDPVPQPLVGIPIKPFGVAKERLHPRLDPESRSALGRAIAAHTMAIVKALAPAAVVTADRGVARWAAQRGLATVEEEPGSTGLDGAARALMAAASRSGHPWLLLHADLPLLEVRDVAALLQEMANAPGVISPSYDGGTTALGAREPVATAYGAGSFHRHLRALPDAAVVVRAGLAHDLDTVADLDRLRTQPRLPVSIRALLGAIDSAP